MMIKILEGLPDNVIGFEAVGTVTAGDYDDVLEPAVAAVRDTNEKARMIYVLGDQFEGYSGGAMWEDTKLGVSNWSGWEKIAVVTDHGAYRDLIKAFGWVLPGEVRVYPTSERDAAIAWATG
jgi:hypothetical protein